jgi:hypothetical protein
MGNLHEGIIDDHRQVIGRLPIGSDDDEIVNLPVLEGNPPAYEVLQFRSTVLRSAKSNRCRLSSFNSLNGLLKRDTSAGPAVPERGIPLGAFSSILFQFFRRAKAIIGLPILN